MHFKRKQFVDKEREKIVKRYIIWITIGTMCPAVYLTYNIVRETFYQTSANNFISHELQFPDTQVLNREIDHAGKTIKVVLLGKEVPENLIVAAQTKLPDYKLNGTKLTVFQGMNNGLEDLSSIKTMVMEDFYKNSQQKLNEQTEEIDSLQRALSQFSGSYVVNEQMGKEMKVIFPDVRSFSVSKGMELNIDSNRIDTVTYAVIGCTRQMSVMDRAKILQWLQARTGAKKLKLIIN